MLTNSLWTGKIRGNHDWIAHVIAIDKSRDEPMLVLYEKNSEYKIQHWLRSDGTNPYGKEYNLIDIRFEDIKPNQYSVAKAIDECNKEALQLMANGKLKEKLGALACAERFKKLFEKTEAILNPKMFLIWEERLGQWWKANSNGYTFNRDEAGRYTAQKAQDICGTNPRILEAQAE